MCRIIACFSMMLAWAVSLQAQEPKKENSEVERFLQFAERGSVELQKTRGLLDVNGSFTIEAWVRWSEKYLKNNNICGDYAAPGIWGDLVEKDSGFGLLVTGVEDADKRCLLFQIGHTPNGAKIWWFVLKTRPVKGTDGIWQHVAVSKTAENIKLFWNGKLAAEKNCKGIRFNGCPSDLYLGIRNGAKDGWGGAFVGDIRAFRAYSKAVYSKAFKPDEVFEKGSGEEILLDFTGEDKEQIDDLSGKKHHGLLKDVKLVQQRALKKN